MIKNIFFACFIFLFFSLDIVAQVGTTNQKIIAIEQELQAENIKSSNENNTAISIRSNVQNAAIYLNGEYQGVTPCTITNLTPGVFTLRIQKTGYETKNFFINVVKSQSRSFYIELEKTIGYLFLSGILQESEVLIDGQSIEQNIISAIVSMTPFEVAEGYHTVTVRKFGFNDFTTNIYVTRRLITPIQVQMTPATFSVSKFSAAKKRFNPTYKGNLGSCSFSFYVTSSNTGEISISDENANIVATYELAQFSSWNQQFIWDGKDNNGNLLPEGVYFATLTTGNFSQTASTQIDYSIIYHNADITKSGSGIGTLPTAFMLGDFSSILSFDISPTFTTAKESKTLYEFPINISFGMALSSWFEFSLGASVHTAMSTSNTPISFNVALKFGNAINLSSYKLCFAGIARYGFITEQLYKPYGADIGNGLGFGIAFGFDSKKLYAGISSEYIIDVLRGNMKNIDSVLKNGISLEFRPNDFITLKTWGASHSLFTYKTKPEIFYAVDTGLGFCVKLGYSSAVLNLKGGALLYLQNKNYNYFFTSIGLTYLF